MDLNILWFILITVLFIGFLFLEGFDYGVGILLPFVGKTNVERRLVINTIGPFWDGNEVWLLTAGGAIFAAFPHWYATLFSGFYLALFLILIALILRGVAFEFRGKHDNPKWRSLWDMMIFVGSAIPALLWGVAISNLVSGVPIGADMEYAGTFFTLLSPFALIGGLVTLLLFSYHGAMFLMLKSGETKILDRAKKIANKLGLVTVVITVVWIVVAFIKTNMFQSVFAIIAIALAAVALIASVACHYLGRHGFAFICSSLTILFVTVGVFAGMFPNVMISTLNPEWSLTIYNASSSPYTLKIMSIVACFAVPIVLLYQAWTYWIFRKRVTRKDLEY